jgi:hypothetical protein
VLCYAGQVPDTELTLCRLRATPERLTDFADLCIDTDDRTVAQAARQVRAQTGGWPQLTP